MKEKKDLSIQVLHIQSWGRPAPRGRGDPHTALRCPVSKERDGFPKGEAARRCAISGAGLTLSRLKGIASPAGEIFRKKCRGGVFPRLPGFSTPPQARTAEAPRGARPRANHALPSPFSSLLSTFNGSQLHSVHALLPTFFSLLSTLSSFFGGRSSI